MQKNWKICKPGQTAGRWHHSQATMDRRGKIKLNRVAWEYLEYAEHAILLYDQATQTIGIQPARAAITNSQPLTASGRHGSCTIDAYGLGRQFGVKFTTTLRFTAIDLDPDGVLNLDLNNAKPAYHGGRIGAFQKERKLPLFK